MVWQHVYLLDVPQPYDKVPDSHEILVGIV